MVGCGRQAARILVGVAVSGLFLLGGDAVAKPRPEWAEPPLASVVRMAPADTWLLLRLDATAYKAGLPDTPIGKILGNRDLSAVLSDILAGLMEFGARQEPGSIPPGVTMRDALEMIQAPFTDLGSAFTGEVGVIAALPEVDWAQRRVTVPVAFVIDTAEVRTARVFLSMAWLGLAAAAGEAVQDAGRSNRPLPAFLPLESVHEDIEGVEVHQLRAKNIPWLHVEYFIVGDRVVISTGGDLYRRLIARQKAATMTGEVLTFAGLDSSETFRTVAGRVQADGAHFLQYVDTGAFLQRVLSILDAEGSPVPVEIRTRVRSSLDASGLAALRAIACTSTFEGAGFKDRSFVWCPEGPKGLLAVSEGGRPGRGDLYWDPAATDAGVCQIDWAMLWDGLWAVADASAPEATGPAREALAAVLGGLDLRAEVFAKLGGEISYTGSTQPGPMPIPSYVVAIESSDPGALIDLAVAQAAARGLPTQEAGRDGERIVTLGVPVMVLVPTLAVDEGFLLLATSPTAARGAIERRKAGVHTFLERADVQDLLGHVPAEWVSFSYSDLGGGLRKAHQQLMMMLPLMTMMMGPGAPQIDLSRLPTADALFGTFFPSVTSGAWGEGGYYSETYGSTGAAFSSIAGVGLVGGGFAAGFGVAVTQDVRGRAMQIEQMEIRRRAEERRAGEFEEWERPDPLPEEPGEDWFDE